MYAFNITMDSMEEDFENIAPIWQLYGFRANPFVTSPLLVSGGVLPLTSFTGRTAELRLLLKLFSSEGGGRTFVFGDVGVGKTTLVNYARAIMYKKGTFTPFDEIGIESDLDSNSFILETLASIYDTMIRLPKRPLTDTTLRKLQNLVDINNTRTNGVGFSILSVGANISSETTTPPQVIRQSLKTFFKELILEISGHTNNRDVIIHYNNLENLKEKYIKGLFEDLRDFFQTPNVQFVFVGNSVVWNLLQGMKRVSSIVATTPIIVRTMSYQEVEELLNKRFKGMRVQGGTGYIIPYDGEVLKTLYGLYNGNIRYILNSLSTATIRITNNRPVVLTNVELATILNKTVNEEVLSAKVIAPRAKEVLFRILENDEMTNKGLSNALKISRPNVSKYVNELVDAGCVELKRQNGKDKYWTVLPHIKWLKLKAEHMKKGGRQLPLQPKFS